MDFIKISLVILSMAIGYLIGSINPGYFFGKLKGIDLREVGTRNAGTSNTYRVLGLRYAAPTAFFDTFKELFVVYLAFYIFGIDLFFAHLSGLMTIIGHIFPFYMHFRGGQGVAVSVGLMFFYLLSYLIINPLLILFLFYDLALVAIFTFVTKRGTILSFIVLPPLGYFIQVNYSNNAYNFFFWIILAHIMLIGMINVVSRKTIQISNETFLKNKWRFVSRPFAIIYVIFYVIFEQVLTLWIIGIVALFYISLGLIHIFRKNEHVKYSSMIIFLVALFLTFLLFPRNIAIIASTFTIFADIFGKIFGLAFGRKKILNKTVEESLAYFGCILICSYVLYTLLNISPFVLFFGGLAAALIEIISTEMVENITIPLFSGLIMYIVLLAGL